MREEVMRVARKWGPAVVGLALSVCLAPTARAQADSPRLTEAAEKVRRHISERMPGWERQPVTPMQPSRDVSVVLWRAGRTTVKVSILLHASTEEAAEGLERIRYHTEIEEQAAKSRGRTNYPSIIEESPALGDEEFIVSKPNRAATAFRKGPFSVGVSMERGDTAPDPKLIREFAVLSAQALSDGVKGYSRAGLPPYGNYVRHPASELVVYYLASRPEKLMPRGAGDTGLYESRDGGRTWGLLSSAFKFKLLFVHPDTGVLFAVADFFWPPGDQKPAAPAPRAADKVIMSGDGRSWTDITGRHEHFTREAGGGRYFFMPVLGISADPNSRGRVCLSIDGVIRVYLLCAADGSYTEWRWRGATVGPVKRLADAKHSLPRAPPDNGMHPTRFSVPLIENLRGFTAVCGRGTPGVGRLSYS